MRLIRYFHGTFKFYGSSDDTFRIVIWSVFDLKFHQLTLMNPIINDCKTQNCVKAVKLWEQLVSFVKLERGLSLLSSDVAIGSLMLSSSQVDLNNFHEKESLFIALSLKFTEIYAFFSRGFFPWDFCYRIRTKFKSDVKRLTTNFFPLAMMLSVQFHHSTWVKIKWRRKFCFNFPRQCLHEN